MLTAAASLALLLAAGEQSGWFAGVQVVGRGDVEPSASDAGGHAVAGELGVASRLGLAARGTAGAAAITWEPQFLLREALAGEPGGVGESTRQGAELGLSTRLARDTRLNSWTRGEWGLTDFSPLAGAGYPVDSTAPQPGPGTQPGPAPQPGPGASAGPSGGRLPARRFLHTLNLGTGIGLDQVLTTGLQLSLGAGFSRSGGVGHDAVQVLPIQLGPRANTSLVWTIQRRHSISLDAAVSQSRFTGGRSSILSEVRAGASFLAYRELRLEAGAGAGFIRSSLDGVLTRASYLAAGAGARWSTRAGGQRKLTASLGAAFSPGLDAITGLPTQSVRGNAALELSSRRWSLGATGSGGRIVSGAAVGARDLRLGAHASWIISGRWSVDGAVGAAYTNQVPLAGWQYEVSAGLRWSAAGPL